MQAKRFCYTEHEITLINSTSCCFTCTFFFIINEFCLYNREKYDEIEIKGKQWTQKKVLCIIRRYCLPESYRSSCNSVYPEGSIKITYDINIVDFRIGLVIWP